MILVLRDGMVTLNESVSLIACYVVYVVFMYYNQSIIGAIDKCCGKGQKLEGDDGDEKKEEEEEEDDESPISKAIARPLQLVFSVTIPDCSEKGNPDSYLATFTMSIVWIGVLSYFMVTWASKLGLPFSEQSG